MPKADELPCNRLAMAVFAKSFSSVLYMQKAGPFAYNLKNKIPHFDSLCQQYTRCPHKKDAIDFFDVTFTNIDRFS